MVVLFRDICGSFWELLKTLGIFLALNYNNVATSTCNALFTSGSHLPGITALSHPLLIVGQSLFLVGFGSAKCTTQVRKFLLRLAKYPKAKAIMNGYSNFTKYRAVFLYYILHSLRTRPSA